MGNIFNMDNKFFTFMGKVADLIILNLVFMVCCIPIVTIGPALTAMFYITLKMVRNEEAYIVRGFFHSFKQNFRQGALINVIMLLIGGVLALDLYIVRANQNSMGRILFIIFMVMAVFYFMVFIYIYPILAKFFNTVKNTFRNAILMSIRHLPYTVLMMVISASPVLIFFIPNATVQSTVIMLFFLMGFSVIAYCNSLYFVKIFDNYIPQEESEHTENEETESEIEGSASDENKVE